MAENQQPVAADAPRKRKRKTEVEKLLEESQSSTNASSTDTDDNPWTAREDLEILRIHRDYHHTNNAKQKAARLNDMMYRIRTTAFQPQKPGRTDKEFMSRVRELKNEGVTVEDLEAELFPEEAPRKRKKKAGK